MSEVITCTKLVKHGDRRDAQGRPVVYHRFCGSPASEVEIGGILGKAKAVLCDKHKAMADNEAFVSVNGYAKGKISKKAKANGYNQPRLPGTGVL